MSKPDKACSDQHSDRHIGGRRIRKQLWHSLTARQSAAHSESVWP
jgi:hypothetical protein